MNYEFAEDFKKAHDFDRKLMCFIFPDGHLLRNTSDSEDMLVLNVRNQIDPCFRQFLASGRWSIPRCVYNDEKPLKAANPFRPTDQFRAFMRKFMSTYLIQSEMNTDRKAVRRAQKQAVAMLTDLINRRRLILGR